MIVLLRILKSIQYIKEYLGHVCQVELKSSYQILYPHPLKSKFVLRHYILANKN